MTQQTTNEKSKVANFDTKSLSSTPVSNALDKLIQLRNKNKLVHMSRLDTPVWINKTIPEAHEFWAGFQLSVANNGSSLSVLGLAGPSGILMSYFLLAVIPFCMPDMYSFVHDRFGFTNMFQPDWVTNSPMIGLLMMITGIPIWIIKYLSRTRDKQKTDCVYRYLMWGISKEYINPSALASKLNSSPPEKENLLAFISNIQSQRYNVDRFLRKAYRYGRF